MGNFDEREVAAFQNHVVNFMEDLEDAGKSLCFDAGKSLCFDAGKSL
jgi:hypothetical protein